MKIELSNPVIDACVRYNELIADDDFSSLAALNLVSFIGERVASLVGKAIDKHAELIARRDRLLAAWRAGTSEGDTASTGHVLGELNSEIAAIERAIGKRST